MLPVHAPPRTQYSSRPSLNGPNFNGPNLNSPNLNLEGYETVQAPKARQYPLFTPPQPSHQVRINIVHPSEMC